LYRSLARSQRSLYVNLCFFYRRSALYRSLTCSQRSLARSLAVLLARSLYVSLYVCIACCMSHSLAVCKSLLPLHSVLYRSLYRRSHARLLAH
ncbi:Hypothetical predicted protein, partial [Pelobates cultripes]